MNNVWYPIILIGLIILCIFGIIYSINKIREAQSLIDRTGKASAEMEACGNDIWCRAEALRRNGLDDINHEVWNHCAPILTRSKSKDEAAQFLKEVDACKGDIPCYKDVLRRHGHEDIADKATKSLNRVADDFLNINPLNSLKPLR